ncbi:FkbM family methyltransferase [Caulobacter flavus]|uniref:FkbM family methyltransferase n=1 Tax=Caulobacter flavus TaxID=1679497 RepID=A0A2N5CM92_9CAUL|nr:FkbM family methyltransferase [Caulobacter flavus]PLR07027.1 FkbM family methyltransferase [Caulobacter flavus]
MSTRPRGENEAEIRSRCASAFLGRGVSVCRVLGRYKLFVDGVDYGLGPHLLLDGYWEMWTTETIARLVKPGMTVADVGANLGYFTLLMADLVGAEGRVHAFEPNPPIAALLTRSVELNGLGERVTVHRNALGAVDGAVATLVTPHGEPKNAHIVEGAATGPGRITVAVRRLDRMGLGEIDFVKIDADTAEQAIWRGMDGLLAGDRPLTVILEFAPARYEDPAGFLALILSQGFSMSLIDLEAGARPVSLEQVLAGPPAMDRMLLLCR